MQVVSSYSGADSHSSDLRLQALEHQDGPQVSLHSVFFMPLFLGLRCFFRQNHRGIVVTPFSLRVNMIRARHVYFTLTLLWTLSLIPLIFALLSSSHAFYDEALATCTNTFYDDHGTRLLLNSGSTFELFVRFSKLHNFKKFSTFSFY